jgi:hypothetical protein
MNLNFATFLNEPSAIEFLIARLNSNRQIDVSLSNENREESSCTERYPRRGGVMMIRALADGVAEFDVRNDCACSFGFIRKS